MSEIQRNARGILLKRLGHMDDLLDDEYERLWTHDGCVDRLGSLFHVHLQA